MNEQLLLENIRGVLVRLEETIIFALVERAQFLANPVAYEANRFGSVTAGESLVGYLLHETERIHARIRRYTSPDEHPFFGDLPPPVLPALRYDENPVLPHRINVNGALRSCYEREIVPFICRSGDDAQYGSTAVCDVACLQALSRRIHYGMFVAESKFRAAPHQFTVPIRARDDVALMALITDAAVEARVLRRVEQKVRTYCQELSGTGEPGRIDPPRLAAVYRRWIIPMTRAVEVEYLLAHPTAAKT